MKIIFRINKKKLKYKTIKILIKIKKKKKIIIITKKVKKKKKN